MSAENKKQQLRSMLAGKSTAELEELLALEAANLDAAEPNADYIATVLEVMAERESAQDEEMTEQAWEDFQEYYSLRKQEEAETDSEEEAPHDHADGLILVKASGHEVLDLVAGDLSDSSLVCHLDIGNMCFELRDSEC